MPRPRTIGEIVGGAALIIMSYIGSAYITKTKYESQLKDKALLLSEKENTINLYGSKYAAMKKALADTVNGLTKRKEDYQKGISILSGCLNTDVNVQEKLLNAYLKGDLSDEKSFRWMMNTLPPYKPKPQIKQKIPPKKK